MDQKQTHQPQNPNRDKAEGDRQDDSTSERNPSSSGGGISNRGMDSDEEQEDLPERGSERGSLGDSER